MFGLLHLDNFERHPFIREWKLQRFLHKYSGAALCWPCHACRPARHAAPPIAPAFCVMCAVSCLVARATPHHRCVGTLLDVIRSGTLPTQSGRPLLLLDGCVAPRACAVPSVGLGVRSHALLIKLVHDVAPGVAHMHELGVLNSDIKAEDVLLYVRDPDAHGSSPHWLDTKSRTSASPLTPCRRTARCVARWAAARARLA